MFRKLPGVLRFTAAISSVLYLIGCSESSNTGLNESTELDVKQSTLNRDKTPSVDEQDLKKFSDGQKTFCLDLYGKLAETEEGNICISPFSISMALAMAYAGAGGTTASEMAEVLHYDMPGPEKIHNTFNCVDQQLASRGFLASGREGKGFKLSINNSLWSEVTFEIKSQFLDLLAINYGAGINALDFINKPEPSRIFINKWVSEKTEEKIKELIPHGVIDSDTRLVLTNTVYFDAAWDEKFNPELTLKNPFYTSNSDSFPFEVPSMHMQHLYKYFENEYFQMVELPYDGGEMSMVLILPKSEELEVVESKLTLNVLSDALSGLSLQGVNLQLPKFNFKYGTISLKQQLMELGIQSAFCTADFSGISDEKISIGDVLHQTFVAVDEDGTTAAAATAVVFVESSYLETMKDFTINKPFLFMIRDIPTDCIIFMGRVVDPR